MKTKAAFCILLLCIVIIGNGMTVLGLTTMDGDGKGEALQLVESTPANGSNAVALTSQIRLLFNKNVVNMAVKDNNSKCFRMLDKNGLEVPIEIIFADDQVEPDKKREIILKARDLLKESMTYKVEILPELQAKNGTGLGKVVSLTFTTLTPEPSPSEEKAKPVVEPTMPEQQNTQAASTDTVKAAEEIQLVVEENPAVESTGTKSEAKDQAAKVEAEHSIQEEPVSPGGSFVPPALMMSIAAAIIAAVITVKKRKP